MANKKTKKKWEWSKIFCTVIATFFALYSVWCGVEYYRLLRLAIESGSMTVPDVSLAVTCVSTVIAALLSYLLYNLGLKKSRNKYGIDENGEPFKNKNE